MLDISCLLSGLCVFGHGPNKRQNGRINFVKPVQTKLLLQGKLFQRCTHFLYCSVLSLGGKVNIRRIPQPDMRSIYTKIINEIFWSSETIM